MRRSCPLLLAFLLAVVLLVAAPAALAAEWWEQPVDYTEIDKPPYDGYTYYSQIPPLLHDIELSSDRVMVVPIGSSALGRVILMAIVAAPETLAALEADDDFRELMLSDPAAAQQALADGYDYKAPLFINGSIHGNESPGVDCALRILDRLAFADLEEDAETKAILDECVVLINVCQNPDGRIAYQRGNGNGFDLNRDFITQTQPETRATAVQIREWLPLLFLDLHGFYNPMRIDPCTPPHNPNYEYDLFIKWAVPNALAMRDAVEESTQYRVRIPYLDLNSGWDDYSPLYTPQYAMYYGSVGLTMETVSESVDGVDCHYYAAWDSMLHAAQNVDGMLLDQIEQLRRGATGYQQPDIAFPGAYVIPAVRPLQKSPLQAARAVQHLVDAGLDVRVATTAFEAEGTLYPAGTYLVRMRQPLRGLANTMLWYGEDVRLMTKVIYSVSSWNLPEWWGFDRAALADAPQVPDAPVDAASWPEGGVAPGPAGAYTLANDSIRAVQAVNTLLADPEVTVTLTRRASAELPAGTFIVRGPRPTLAEVGAALNVTFVPWNGDDPAGSVTLAAPRVASVGPSDQLFVLRGLGFDVTSVGSSGPLDGYDVVVGENQNLAGGVLKAYVDAGGDYVGIGYRGTSGQLGTLLPVKITLSGSTSAHAIVRADYAPDSVVAAYYPTDDFAFVYRPIWFSKTGDGARVNAWYAEGDPFVSGFWSLQDRTKSSGMPAVVSGTYGLGDVVYIGFAPQYRAYPENTFRLVANAIWYGAD